VITYRAALDVPASTLARVSRWLAAHRKAHDAPALAARRDPVRAGGDGAALVQGAHRYPDSGPGRRGEHRARLSVPA
jgi:hypothetical protein